MTKDIRVGDKDFDGREREFEHDTNWEKGLSKRLNKGRRSQPPPLSLLVSLCVESQYKRSVVTPAIGTFFVNHLAF